jgi:hypothetical protein
MIICTLSEGRRTALTFLFPHSRISTQLIKYVSYMLINLGTLLKISPFSLTFDPLHASLSKMGENLKVSLLMLTNNIGIPLLLFFYSFSSMLDLQQMDQQGRQIGVRNLREKGNVDCWVIIYFMVVRVYNN